MPYCADFKSFICCSRPNLEDGQQSWHPALIVSVLTPTISEKAKEGEEPLSTNEIIINKRLFQHK